MNENGYGMTERNEYITSGKQKYISNIRNSGLDIDDFPNHKEMIDAVVTEAAIKEMNAAYSGLSHDGGSGNLIVQLIAWLHGIQGTVPSSLHRYDRDTDPEYQRYLELKRKFGE